MKTMRRKAARPAISRSATAPVSDPVDRAETAVLVDVVDTVSSALPVALAVTVTASDVTDQFDRIGLAVPPRVIAALGCEPADAASMRIALLGLAGRLARLSHPRDAAVVDDLAALALRALERQPAIDGDFGLRLSTACFTYLERVGRREARLRFADRVLAYLDSLPGVSSRCTAHHFAAVARLSVDDPKQAWTHAECAYELASGFETSTTRFEILILATQILDSMGLPGDARNLALQLADFPDGDPVLDTLHLVNATHGMSLCHRLDDVATACRFHDLARTKAATRLLPDSAGVMARFEAARAVHLARTGRARSAERVLGRVIDRGWPADGRRSEVLLRCAQAEVNLVLGLDEHLGRSLGALQGLLADLHPTCTFYQETLRAIVKLALKRDADGDRELAMHYLHQLRDQPSLATTDPWIASDLLSLHEGLSLAEEGLRHHKSPGQTATFVEVGSHEWVKEPGRCPAGPGLAWAEASGAAAMLSRPEFEASLRTRAYRVAEDWAVVAEIARGGDGRRCFKVGQVAAAIAAALGFSIARCVLIELGCRLRNIGHATLLRSQDSDQRRNGAAREGEPCVAAVHADAGERMLSFSSDPVLRLATRIAKSHHACWNGTGYPAWRGEAIPIEARICAVADTLIDLVDPIGARKPWALEIALRQMHCMAGVQLDPDLVDVLHRLLNDGGSATSDPALRWESSRASDALVEARKQLVEQLELAA